MKNYYLFFALIFSISISAQTKQHDPIALQIFDHMSDVIGELESCTFNLDSSSDFIDPDYGLIKKYSNSSIVFSGPNKMAAQINGNKGHKGFYYNGEQVVYFSYTENNYAIIDAPDNTIATIDTLHFDYGINFPAADFFYPAFTDDLMSDFDTIKFIGKKIINNEECFHIKAENEFMIAQYWVSNDLYKLPKKYSIIYKDNGNLQYESTFSNWEMNQKIPDAIFEFTPPAKSRKIKILAKK